jgi:raffinose/stachyose/melibiose transport system substrate-binding protein
VLVSLLLLPALLVAACGSGTQDEPAGGSDAAKGGTTLTLTHLTDNQPGWEAVFAEYKKVAPDVNFKASYAPVDQLQTQLRAQLGGGNAPDLFVAWPGNGSAMSVQQLAPSGLLADLSDQDWINNVPEGLRPLFGTDGKTYMWTYGLVPIGAIYNKKVFKEAGVDKIPQTWSELEAACDKVKAAGKVCLALGNQTPWITQLIPYAIAPSTAFNEDPNLAQDMLDGKKSFQNSDWDEVFKRYLELNEKGYFNDNPNGTTFEQQQELVASGKAAMAVQVSPTATAISQAAKNPDDIGMFAFPAADEKSDLKIPAGLGAGVGVSAKSPNIDEAKKFIEFLGTPEAMTAYAEAMKAIPIVPSGDYKPDPMLAPFVPFVEDDKTVPFMDQQWPNAEVQPAHFAGIQELFAGKTTVQGLLKSLDEAYKK